MKDKIVLPYAPILVESTRSIGYSFEAAVADIIDNSITVEVVKTPNRRKIALAMETLKNLDKKQKRIFTDTLQNTAPN